MDFSCLFFSPFLNFYECRFVAHKDDILTGSQWVDITQDFVSPSPFLLPSISCFENLIYKEI